MIAPGNELRIETRYEPIRGVMVTALRFSGDLDVAIGLICLEPLLQDIPVPAPPVATEFAASLATRAEMILGQYRIAGVEVKVDAKVGNVQACGHRADRAWR